MPYERQLKERQVYKTLSICVELIKSDVNQKFRLKVSSNVIYRRRFQEVEYQKCSISLQHPTDYHKEKKRKRVILTSCWSAKIWYKRVLFPNFFNVFRHCEHIGLRYCQNFRFKAYNCMF